MLADTYNVLNGHKCKLEFNASIWIPEINDNQKEISIKFSCKRYIAKIVLYSGLNEGKHIDKIMLSVGAAKRFVYLKDLYVNEIIINDETEAINIKELTKQKIMLDGFSEIEIFDTFESEFQEANNSYFWNTQAVKKSKFEIYFNEIMVFFLSFICKVVRKLYINSLYLKGDQNGKN